MLIAGTLDGHTRSLELQFNIVHASKSKVIPYSGKFSREKSFTDFEVFGLPAKALRKTTATPIPNWRRQAIHESFPCEFLALHQFVKVFSLASFPLYSNSLLMDEEHVHTCILQTKSGFMYLSFSASKCAQIEAVVAYSDSLCLSLSQLHRNVPNLQQADKLVYNVLNTQCSYIL